MWPRKKAATRGPAAIKYTYDPPTTPERWKARLRGDRALIGTIYEDFNVTVEDVVQDLLEKMNSIPGFAALNTRNKIPGQRGAYDFTELKNRTAELEDWLRVHEVWGPLIGDSNTAAPEHNKIEARRSIIFAAKVKLHKMHLKEASQVDDDLLLPRRESIPPAGARSAMSSLCSGTQGFCIEDLADRVLQSAIVVVDSRSFGTITRVPMDKILRTDVPNLLSAGNYDGSDFDLNVLRNHFNINYPNIMTQEMWRLWDDNNHAISVFEDNMQVDTEDGAFERVVNSFIQGPRFEANINVVFQLGPWVKDPDRE
jgi:hypothetical protein